jgi:hypothetical protein
MRLRELLRGYPSPQTDDPGRGPSRDPGTPLATVAAPVDQELELTGLKPLRRLKRLDRGAVKD